MAIFSTPPSNLKHRVFTCLTKLSDRDTYSVACSELESIARNLEPSSFQSFLSCIHSTDASDKSPVRKQCVRLLAILSETHGNALSPHISKMISNIIRRLRDPDSSVRSACVGSVTALASHVTKPPFPIFLKAFADALFTEQDVNSQIGAALCLASAIDAAPDPEPVKLGKLLPKLEKLLKCESYKARPALLTLLGSVIACGGASSCEASKNLVPCLVGFLGNEDWATRKSAAEALAKLAVSEREFLSEFKSDCMKTFENRRFDKVKLVREAMGRMLEAWKQIPDISGDVSSPSLPLSSSKEKDDNDCYPAGSKNISIAAVQSSQPRRKIIPSSRSSPPDNSLATTARKRSPLGCKDKQISPASVRKPDRKKLQEWKVEIAVSKAPTSRGTVEGELKGRNENVQDKKTTEKMKISKPEAKRALFSKNSDDKMHKFGGFRSGSRVAPLHDDSPESAVVVSNVTEDQNRNPKDTEELFSIRNQLAQIEKQQSNLMDLLQRFIGSSQNGMQSLETRVQGLELALDEISYDLDLALSNGRITGTDSWRTSCCLLPGAKFLTSKFRKKTDGRLLTSRISTSGATPMSGMSYRAERLSNSEAPSHRFRLQGSGGFIVNPLAEIQGQSRGVSDPANHNL